MDSHKTGDPIVGPSGHTSSSSVQGTVNPGLVMPDEETAVYSHTFSPSFADKPIEPILRSHGFLEANPSRKPKPLILCLDGTNNEVSPSITVNAFPPSSTHDTSFSMVHMKLTFFDSSKCLVRFPFPFPSATITVIKRIVSWLNRPRHPKDILSARYRY